jgi:hypothetical protein
MNKSSGNHPPGLFLWKPSKTGETYSSRGVLLVGFSSIKSENKREDACLNPRRWRTSVRLRPKFPTQAAGFEKQGGEIRRKRRKR